MSTCYGRLTGSRGEVTRTGSKTSGITATVQTWDGALTLRLKADGSYALTQHAPHNRAPHVFGGKVVAEGNLPGSPADLTDEYATEARPEPVEEPTTTPTITRLRRPEGSSA